MLHSYNIEENASIDIKNLPKIIVYEGQNSNTNSQIPKSMISTIYAYIAFKNKSCSAILLLKKKEKKNNPWQFKRLKALLEKFLNNINTY